MDKELKAQKKTLRRRRSKKRTKRREENRTDYGNFLPGSVHRLQLS